MSTVARWPCHGRKRVRFFPTIRALLMVHPITIDVHEIGLLLAERDGPSTCDAMIAASALEADCDTLRSEDMQDGIVLGDRLRIVNPFGPPLRLRDRASITERPHIGFG